MPPWVPGGVGEVDEVMHYHYILLGASEWWKAAGEVVSAAGMPSSAPFVHLGGGYAGVLHNKTLLAGLPLGLPGGMLLWRNPPAIICRRHILFHPGLGVGSPYPIHHDGDILRLIRVPAEQSQIHIRGFWPIYVRDGAMSGHFEDADWHAPHLILRFAID